MVCLFGCNVFHVICFDCFQDLPRLEYVPQRFVTAGKVTMNKKLDIEEPIDNDEIELQNKLKEKYGSDISQQK